MLGLLFLVIGGLLLVVDNVAAYVALGIGVTLLLLVPGAAAFMGAERQFRPDHKVEGRTFVVDLAERRFRPLRSVAQSTLIQA